MSQLPSTHTHDQSRIFVQSVYVFQTTTSTQSKHIKMDHAKPLPSDMALKLLNSKDSKVAAAARRVFSNAVIIEEPFLKTSDLSEVPKEIREAASAVINLMPRVHVNTGVKKITKNTSFSQAIQELDHRRNQEETETEKVSTVPKEKQESQVTYSELNTSSQEKKRIVDPKERIHRR